MSKPTCGVLYREAIERFADSRHDQAVFAAGFITGQAEKVYLGACKAAMFRPAEDWKPIAMLTVANIIGIYGLMWTEIGDELWIFRAENYADVHALRIMDVDSPQWHEWRGHLCGVPRDEIDTRFHKRKGCGERCEPEVSS